MTEEVYQTALAAEREAERTRLIAVVEQLESKHSKFMDGGLDGPSRFVHYLDREDVLAALRAHQTGDKP